MSWLYVPGLTASHSDSPSPNLVPELSVTSRGKSMSWRQLLNAWKEKSFMRLLSGITLEASTANRGVAEFIASLEDIPALQPERSFLPAMDTFQSNQSEWEMKFLPISVDGDESQQQC